MNQHTSDNQYVISEFYSFTPDRKIIQESIDRNEPIIINCILQKANALNRNGRVYPFNILKREVDKYMELINEKSSMGELDHPDSAVISLSNVSHIVSEAWWEGDTLYGKIQVAETPSGDILKGLLKSGFKLGISSRGVGSVKNIKGKDVVQEDFELIGFDVVSSPSTIGAFLFKEGKQWGMKKLTLEDTKLMRADEMKNKHINNITSNNQRIIDLAKDNYWKI